MQDIKVEWCENFIRATFSKHFPAKLFPDVKNPAIEMNFFWKLAEESGLWVRGDYHSPMSVALANLCEMEWRCNNDGEYLYTVFRLKGSFKKGA